MRANLVAVRPLERFAEQVDEHLHRVRVLEHLDELGVRRKVLDRLDGSNERHVRQQIERLQ